MFRLFAKAQKIECEADGKTWKPFKGLDLTKLLKSVTLEVAGVEVTVSKLRAAAETHCSVIEGKDQNEINKIQESLNYVEGHSQKIATDHYKLNQANKMSNAWHDYVDSLFDPQGKTSSRKDLCRKNIDERICHKMNKLHADWKQSVQKELKRRRRGGQEVEEYERKKRVKWSAEEDAELLDQVDCCGEGEWTKILKNSKILQNRYKSSHSSKLHGRRKRYHLSTHDVFIFIFLCFFANLKRIML